MSEPVDTTEPTERKRDELACPDCAAPPAWVGSESGWAKCSRCELAWPASRGGARSTPPVGAVVPLPRPWRLQRSQASHGYRSEAKEHLRVEIGRPPRWEVAAFLTTVGSWVLAIGMLATHPTAVDLAAALGGLGCLTGVVGLLLLTSGRPTVGHLTFDTDRTRVVRSGGATDDVGFVERLTTRSLGQQVHAPIACALVLDTANEKGLIIIRSGPRPEVESVLREIGRHLSLAFDRKSGELIAYAQPPPRVRVSDDAAGAETSAEAENTIEGNEALEGPDGLKRRRARAEP